MDELNDFISILDAECEVLKKAGIMLKSVKQPWRYFAPPLIDQHEYDHLKAVIEAGRYTVKAEEEIKADNEAGAWQALAKAQAALLKSISSYGKAKAKRIGNSKGGQSKFDEVHYIIFCMADDLLASGHTWRGLAKTIANKLSEQTNNPHKTEHQIREILIKQKHMLVND